MFIKLNESFEGIKTNEVGIIKKSDEDNKTNDVLFANGVEKQNIPQSKCLEFDINDTGDEFSEKICNVCGRLLPVNNFQKNQNGKNNRTVRRPTCRECREKIDGKNIPSAMKKEWLKKKPNLIVWTCPICNRTTIPGITSRVVLDHDHKTGIPNAWICDSCNTGLGRFKDDKEILNRAIKYLEEHDKNSKI